MVFHQFFRLFPADIFLFHRCLDTHFFRCIDEKVQRIFPVFQDVVTASSDDDAGRFLRKFLDNLKLVIDDTVGQIRITRAILCLETV